jgi:cysteinyl-tRNA synthetase
LKSLDLYNTLTRKIEEFSPIKKDEVKLYSCGPTVYSYPHIGNMRAYTFTDTLVRTLIFLGYNVKNLINITDVGHLTSDSDLGDDKMEKEAKKQNISAYDIANKYEDIFKKNIKDLNIIEPSMYPRATEHIKEQIDLIKILESNNYTYRTTDGIYFNSEKFKGYSNLGKIDIDGLREGLRVDFNNKKNKTDFALWKFSSQEEKREMEWDSPWGTGFPGWHIECSAMAMKHLGETIDIHTGGIDHIPIHHTNEIAQSECATGKTFSNYWMHVNFLQIIKNEDDITTDKMSKSKGNILTVDDLAERGFHPMTLKYLYLTAHYRKELKFDMLFNGIKAAKKSLNRIYRKIDEIKGEKTTFSHKESDYYLNVINCITSDLNTPMVLAEFQNGLNDNSLCYDEHMTLIKLVDDLLGIELIVKRKDENIPIEVIKLAENRLIARKDLNWILSDEIRSSIEALGYSIKDESNGYKINKI